MNAKAIIKYEKDRLFISGDLDFANVVTIWNESLPLLATCQELRFDFSQTTSSKSAGLALLLEWMKLAKRENKPVFFHAVPSQLMSIAGVCGVDKLLQAFLIDFF